MQILGLLFAIGSPILLMLSVMLLGLVFGEREIGKSLPAIPLVILFYALGMWSAYAAVSILLDELNAAGVMQ